MNSFELTAPNPDDDTSMWDIWSEDGYECYRVNIDGRAHALHVAAGMAIAGSERVWVVPAKDDETDDDEYGQGWDDKGMLVGPDGVAE